jgi:hypothetical protein
MCARMLPVNAYLTELCKISNILSVLFLPYLAKGSNFGGSLALDGNRLLIAAKGVSGGTLNTGR